MAHPAPLFYCISLLVKSGQVIQNSKAYINIYAAAAKSLQLCPTLCDPKDGSPPDSPVPGILQAGTLQWVASRVVFTIMCYSIFMLSALFCMLVIFHTYICFKRESGEDSTWALEPNEEAP